MSDIIRLLPEATAIKVAAGEIVPSPGYLIKELMENSLDAGAKKIQVEVVGAGLASISVTDDGKGMSPTDARMAFERHATSKLQTVDDLYKISTMGFRGEALAAIAGVCQVELHTRMADQEVGTELIIEGSKVKSQTPVACPAGTTLKAMNIFYNIPARRKQLETRKEATELSEIWREFAKIALAHPKIAFDLRGTGKYDKMLPATSLKERIIGIGGSRLSKALIPVEYVSDFCTIQGFIGKPDTAIKSGAQQYFFANNRFIRHPYFQKAINLAYEDYIPAGTQPHYFLYFTIPASNIDVNFHPQKIEVKITDEKTIFPILQSLIREAFSAHALTPSIDFDRQDSISIPAYPGRRADIDISMPSGLLPDEDFPLSTSQGTSTRSGIRFSSSFSAGSKHPLPAPDPEWDKLGENFDHMRFEQDYPVDPLFKEEDTPAPTGIRLSQVKTYQPHPILPTTSLSYQGRYIVTILGDNLAFIDMMRAVLKITYEAYRADLQAQQFEIVPPLFPEVLDFAPHELPTAQLLMEHLTKVGFDFGDLGDGHFSIVEAPSFIAQEAPGFVRLLVANSLDTHRDDEEYVHSLLAEVAAESLALHKPLPKTPEEQMQLMTDLFQCPDPYFTPSRKPIVTLLTEPMVANFFS